MSISAYENQVAAKNNMKNVFPVRKPTRSDKIDYGKTGVYFITVCTEKKQKILSDVTGNCNLNEGDPQARHMPLQKVVLLPCGKIAEIQLLLLEKRWTTVAVKHYGVMPNHIHIILCIDNSNQNSEPENTTLMAVMCAFKSLTSKMCKKEYGIEKVFQRSFYDHVIRDRDDYEKHARYIYENPMKWFYDDLYVR